MKKHLLIQGRRLAAGLLFATAAATLWANGPDVVIMYNDGTQSSYPISSVNRMEIGSDAVVMVHSAGSESYNRSDIKRILIGAESTAVKNLPSQATLAVWPTAVDQSVNVLPAADCEVNIYDLDGRLVAGPLETTGGSALSIDMSGLGAGWYILQADGHTVKLIKK